MGEGGGRGATDPTMKALQGALTGRGRGVGGVGWGGGRVPRGEGA